MSAHYNWIILYMVAFQFKHFICDFPLQTPYMLGKFKATKWVKPLASHAGVHALATFLIVATWKLKLAPFLALFDFINHFVYDRVKADPKLGGRFKALSSAEFSYYSAHPPRDMKERLQNNKYFWWTLGLDQMAHHLTHYAIIVMMFM